MKKLSFIFTIICLVMADIGYGQATFPDNQPVAGRYLGFNDNSLIPLPIRNDGNRPIEFSTNQILRMTLGADGRFVFNATIPQTTASFSINALSGFPSALRANSANVALNNFAGRFTANNGLLTNTGALVQINSDPSDYNQGMAITTNGITKLNYGVRSQASNAAADGFAAADFGVLGTAYSNNGGKTSINYGVRGEACGARTNIGVYGSIKPTDVVCGTVPGSKSYAGYFAGDVVHNGSEINPSDQNLKTSIEPLTGATEILAQLQAKTYTFLTDEYGFMGLPDGVQYGLISQEVQPILPSVVSEVTFPAQLNMQGEVQSPEVNFLGLEYKPFIPILIAAFNEQNSVVSMQTEEIDALQHQLETQAEQMGAQAQRIADLEDDLKRVLTSLQQTKSDVNHCCGRSGATGQNDNGPAVMDGVELEQNVPNPFTDQTTISFDLPDAAVVRVEISDSAGRLLETLHNGRMDTGRHTVTWDATRYPSGVYYYSLYADAALLTKKMIKR